MDARYILIVAALVGASGGAIWAGDPPTTTVSTPERDTVEAVKAIKNGEANVYYSGCNEVRALGKAPLHAGEPGYRLEMDGDGDGIACEPHRRRF